MMEMPPHPPVRLWCLAAPGAPVIAVFARVRTTTGRWTHLVRWNFKQARVEAGAWSRLQILGHRCALSADGQFLMYTAKGPLGGPFDASSGGGIAISRLPWLASLTFIHPAAVAGGGESKHMLPREQQDKLWSLFGEPFYLRDEDWPAHLGRNWSRLEPARAHPIAARFHPENFRDHVVAAAPLRGRGLSLIALAHRRRAIHPQAGTIRYFLAADPPEPESLHPLENTIWAAPSPTDERSRILIATRDAHLQVLTPRTSGDPAAPLKLEQDHDLSALTPNPGPAPAWATARV
jgi:hypothetical protein